MNNIRNLILSMLLLSSCNVLREDPAFGNQGLPQGYTASISNPSPVADGAEAAVVVLRFDAAVKTAPTVISTGAQYSLHNCVSQPTVGLYHCPVTSTLAESRSLAVLPPYSRSLGNVVFRAGPVDSGVSSFMIPTHSVADGASTVTFELTLRDAFSNPITGITPDLESPDPGINFLGCTPTDGAGLSLCTANATLGGPKEIRLSSPVALQLGQTNFSAVQVNLAASTFSISTSTVADGAALSTVTMVLRDGANVPVQGLTPTLQVSGTGNSSVNCGPSNTNGEVVCSFSSTKAETKTLSITAPVVSVLGQTLFTPGAVAQSRSSTAISAGTVADGASSVSITVQFKDLYDNPIAGLTPLLTITGTDNLLSCAPSGADGTASCALRTTKSEQKNIYLTWPFSTSLGSVVFSPGPPASATSTATLTSSGVIANGVAQAEVAVTFNDAAGNPVAGVTPILSISGTSNQDLICLDSDGAGVARCTFKSTKAEPKQIALTAPISKQLGSISFIPGAPEITSSTFVASASVTADGVATGTITATFRDAHGNLVSGVVPAYSASGTLNVFGSCAASGSDGVSLCELRSTKAETKTISLTAPFSAAVGTMTFTAGAPALSTSSAQISSPVIADGVAEAELSVVIRDSNSNPVEGVTPTYSVSGSQNTIGVCGQSTSGGTSTCRFRSTKAETKTVQLLSPVGLSVGTVVFAPGPAHASTSSVSASGPVTADGTAASNISITLRDLNGNLISGATPTIAVDGSENTIGSCGVTDAAGASTCSLRSTFGETKTVSVSGLSGGTASTSVIFTPTPLTLTVTPSGDDTIIRRQLSWSWVSNKPSKSTYRFTVSTASSWTPTGAFGSTTSTSQSSGSGTYYVHVQARSSEGIESSVVSRSVTLDNTAPIFSSLSVGTNDSRPNRSPSFSWGAATDNLSIDRYQVALGTSSQGTEVVNWMNLSSSVLSYRFQNGVDGNVVSLQPGTNYFISVKAIDTVGNETVLSSTAFQVSQRYFCTASKACPSWVAGWNTTTPISALPNAMLSTYDVPVKVDFGSGTSGDTAALINGHQFEAMASSGVTAASLIGQSRTNISITFQGGAIAPGVTFNGSNPLFTASPANANETGLNSLVTGIAYRNFVVNLSGLVPNATYFVYFPLWGWADTSRRDTITPSDGNGFVDYNSPSGSHNIRMLRYGFVTSSTGTFSFQKNVISGADGLCFHGVVVVRATDPN